MKKKNPVRMVTALLAVCMLCTGCGASTNSESVSGKAATASYSATDQMYQVNNEVVSADTAEESAESAGEVTSAQTQQKLIKNVSMSVETLEFDALLPNVQKRVTDLGGYVSSIDKGENSNSISPYSPAGRNAENRTRYANIVAKVPADKVDSFVSEVAEISNVTSQNERVEDVTLQYVDLESHKKALETEQESLMNLMERAENVEDIIAIEGQLSEVRYQLESMQSQLRALDNQISYSEVSIYIIEVQNLTQLEEESVWSRISNGFAENLMSVGRGIREFAIAFVIHLPSIALLAVIVVFVLFLIRTCRKHSEKKIQKRNAKRDGKEASGYGQFADSRNQLLKSEDSADSKEEVISETKTTGETENKGDK